MWKLEVKSKVTSHEEGSPIIQNQTNDQPDGKEELRSIKVKLRKLVERADEIVKKTELLGLKRRQQPLGWNAPS